MGFAALVLFPALLLALNLQHTSSKDATPSNKQVATLPHNGNNDNNTLVSSTHGRVFKDPTRMRGGSHSRFRQHSARVTLRNMRRRERNKARNETEVNTINSAGSSSPSTRSQ